MNPRIERFLNDVEQDLHDLLEPVELKKQLDELRAHLQDAVEEHESSGSHDPTGDALNCFGSPVKFTESLYGVLRHGPAREAERAALLWCSAIVCAPVCADVAVDFGAQFTGMDFRLTWMWIPLLWMCFHFIRRSMRVKRVIGFRIAGVVGAALAFSIILGGFSRAASGDITIARGTVIKRHADKNDNLIRNLNDRLEVLRSGNKVFLEETNPSNVGEFRVSDGYLAPSLRDGVSERIKKSGGEYFDSDFVLRSVPTYAEASADWNKYFLTMESALQQAVRREYAEKANLMSAVHSGWWETVRLDLPYKSIVAIVTFVWLILMNAIGIALGQRRRNSRKSRA